MVSDFSNLALLEMKDAYDYYLTKVGMDTAQRFEEDLLIKIEYLVKFYEANPLVKDSKRKPRKKNRRFVTLDNFPYHIYYVVRIDVGVIFIDRVLHRSRDILSLLKE